MLNAFTLFINPTLDVFFWFMNNKAALPVYHEAANANFAH